MPIINVFRDKDGDYLVTNSAKVEPGAVCWQLNGHEVDQRGGPIDALSSHDDDVLIVMMGELANDTAPIIAELQHTLVDSAEQPHLYTLLQSFHGHSLFDDE